MCDLGKLAQGTNWASTGLKAGTQVMQGRYESSVLRQNEILASRGAQAERVAGAAQATEIKRQGAKVIGAQEAALAANGVDPSSSRSALHLLSDTAYISELDAGTAIANADKQAKALELEAANAKAARKNLPMNTALQVGGTALTGTSNAYGIYKTLKG
jgi:hypothetical protein